MVYAYRAGSQGEALSAFADWQGLGVEHERLSPWYHEWLHSVFGFRTAQYVLAAVRRLAGKSQADKTVDLR